jgi:PTS system nitrogen regulatory IIA component
MNLIANILPLEHIQLNAVVTSKKRAFEQASILFENHLGIARDKTFDSLIARERLGSTGLGQQVAVPHGRIKNLKKASSALLRVQNPIPFEAPDGLAVKLMIFLLVPESANQSHLDLLSELAQMLSDKTFRDHLCNSQDPAEVYRLVHQWTPLNR